MAYPEVDTLYVDGQSVYFSPDGIGRVFFNSLKQAKAETGLSDVTVILTVTHDQ